MEEALGELRDELAKVFAELAEVRLKVFCSGAGLRETADGTGKGVPDLAPIGRSALGKPRVPPACADTPPIKESKLN